MTEPRPLTKEFQLKRMQISLAIAQQYVRTFWWLLAGVPVFGVLCLLFATDPVIRLCGLICVLWPLTIPARAFILTSKPSRQLLKPTTLLLGDESFVLRANDNTGLMVRKKAIRSIIAHGDVYVVQTRMLGIFLIPVGAFLSDGDRKTFEQLAG